MRGEYFQAAEASGQELELPPRARRIHALPLTQFPQRGTTSACAENTYGKKHVILAMRNYLRVRGEYPVDAPLPPAWAELPPRARRIQPPLARASIASGTTSACAENTSWRRGRRFGWRNYLRVRGEYQLAAGSSIRLEELPPRARRIQILLVGGDIPPGTTSACAENTYRGHQNDQNEGNYLRVRGEYLLLPWVIWWPAELPPRARRIRDKVYAAADGKGTTSACAENTPATGGSCTQNWNYLRVRGEYVIAPSSSM